MVIGGICTSIAMAMRQAGVSVSKCHSRLRISETKACAASTPSGRRGSPDAITEPVYQHDAKEMWIGARSKELGFKYRTVLQRINRAPSFAEAIEHKFCGRLP